MLSSRDAPIHAVTQITELNLVSYVLYQIIHFSDFDQKFYLFSQQLFLTKVAAKLMFP